MLKKKKKSHEDYVRNRLDQVRNHCATIRGEQMTCFFQIASVARFPWCVHITVSRGVFQEVVLG